MSNNIMHFDELPEMADQALEFFIQTATDAIGSRGRFDVAISGGNSPRLMFSLLAKEPHIDSFPWDKTHWFWVDERWISPESFDCNYKWLHELLFSRVDIPRGNLHPIPLDTLDAPTAAALYEKKLEKHFNITNDGNTAPEFDLVILGVGADGHTASIFPKSPAIKEDLRWVLDVPAPTTSTPKLPRITMTYPVLNNARNIAFIVVGEEKRNVLEDIFEGGKAAAKYPASKIAPSQTIQWFLCV